MPVTLTVTFPAPLVQAPENGVDAVLTKLLFVGAWIETAGAPPLTPALSSARSKLMSELPAHCWWISTASVLVPVVSSAGLTLYTFQAISSAPSMLTTAFVVDVMVPVGMLLRTTSVPFR